MLKKTLLSMAISTALTIPAWASQNACLNDMESHTIDERFLMLSHCNLTAQDMKEVSAYLQSHPDIQYLFLGRNQIGDQGAKIIAQNTTLEYAALDDNGISAKGVKALTQNTTWKMLSLSYNPIGNSNG